VIRPTGCRHPPPLSLAVELLRQGQVKDPLPPHWDKRAIYSNHCCGSRMFIPDLTFFHPGSRIRIFPSRICIKEFKYFNPKKWFLSSRKYNPGYSSRIPDPDPYFLPNPYPGSRGQKGTGSRIRHTDSNHINYVT
jgi:hypothetical protein